jgi:hypothetical protein
VPDAPPPETPQGGGIRSAGPSRPNAPCESYLRSRGVRPAHLARECGYGRAHLLRIPTGRVEPTPACAVGIVYALRPLVHKPVVLTNVFAKRLAEAAWHTRHVIVPTFHSFEHRAVRAALGKGGHRG